jgi:hypothetical protein
MRMVASSLAFVMAIASLLGGCSPLDVYAFRAIQYNFEAEETQNQVVLLNIIRSSLHRPMEFTEITNIVGSNSASGSASFSFPVGYRLPTGVTTGTAGSSLTGTTTFTIPVLDTQDFYEGLLSDIQPSLLGYYFQTPFISEVLLLNLFIERIVVRKLDPVCKNSHISTCERNFRNNPVNSEDIALFQTFINYLLSLEVSAEPLAAKTKSQTIKAGSTTINISGSSSGTTSDSSEAGGSAAKSTPYRLCFSPRVQTQDIPTGALCGNNKSTSHEIAPNTTIDGIRFSPDLARIMLDVIGDPNASEPCRQQSTYQALPADSYAYEESIRAFCGRKVAITLQFRSTGSIFNFLGQLVERAQQSGLTFALPSKTPFRPQPDNWLPCWMITPPVACRPIISVRPDASRSLVSITYNASLYAVPSNPTLSYSPDVFTILKQLIALNLSGKNLPTTAILSVTSAGGP